MDGLHVFLIVLLGVTSGHQLWISHSVTAGDNITLYCDCKISTGLIILWYRNCSHQNQPTLVLDSYYETRESLYTNIPPRFKMMRNHSSNSYDLEISNVTASDEGLYYCGTKETKVEEIQFISRIFVYKYGNVTTNVTVGSSDPHPAQNCDKCWTLLFSVCPVVAVVSSLLSSLLVYHACRNKGVKNDQIISDLGSKIVIKQGEDVCYAALNIHLQQDQGRKCTTLTFCTYSAIKMSRM
ncbi:uncharacterized protein LOC114472337 [Gouania willdenowi]|uniref:uncharacterized protein LOC114472337 n=1 Tax=Gouania willdenowi TaxID=441366 RepID=UPI0010541F56|nr:uncharacterized protein LOC114472337 [Gouania willdenowi]